MTSRRTSLLNFLLYVYLGVLTSSGLEAHIFDRMPNRDKNEPLYPDYQLEFLSCAQDNNFINNGLPLNHNKSVCIYLNQMIFEHFRLRLAHLVYIILLHVYYMLWSSMFLLIL